MQGQGKLLTGVIVGAGAMYLLDPDRGASRRSHLREQGIHVGHKLRGNGVQSLEGVERDNDPDAEGTRPDWRPATWLAVGALGSLVALQGSRTRGLQGRVLSLVGSGLVTRAAVNLPARRLITLIRGARPVTVEKTLLVGTSIDRVWELWSNFEGFPRFMTHLREVRKIEEGRSHWLAVGPAGVPAEWEAIITDWVPGQFIGWRSVENSPIETSGQVRLSPVSDRETQIDVQLTYTPPAGAPGQVLASLLGVDPKRALDEDLLRLTSLLEDQQASVGEETIHLQEEASGSGKPTGRTKKTSTRKK
jgi:uncharacterized membrane protein